MAIIRNEVVAMPFIRVRCTNAGCNLPEDGWPEHVQCLPPVGSLMDNRKHRIRAYVESYCFFSDGHIDLMLTNQNPLS
jgi:hypothetical protein